jgi:hypothetical protein
MMMAVEKPMLNMQQILEANPEKGANRTITTWPGGEVESRSETYGFKKSMKSSQGKILHPESRKGGAGSKRWINRECHTRMMQTVCQRP